MIKNENISNTLKNNKSNIKNKNNKNNFHVSINNSTINPKSKNPKGNTIYLGKSLNNNCKDNNTIEKTRNSLLKEKNRTNVLFNSPINKKNKIIKIDRNYTEIKINSSKQKNDREISKDNNKNKIYSIERNNSINNTEKLLQKMNKIKQSSNQFKNKNIKANKNITQSNNFNNNNININNKKSDKDSYKIYFIYKDEILNNEIDKNKKHNEETRNINCIERRINNIYKSYDKDDIELNNYHKDFKDEIISLKSSCDKAKYDENIIVDTKEEDISDYINVNSIYYQNILYNCVNEIGNEAIEEVDEGKEDSEMTSLSTENNRKSKNKNIFSKKMEQDNKLKGNNIKEIIKQKENKLSNEHSDKKISNIKKLSSYSRFINTKSLNITKENISLQNNENEIKLNGEKIKNIKKNIKNEKINHSQNMRKNKTINIFLEDNENEYIIPPKKMVILSKIKNNDNKYSNKTQKLNNFNRKNRKDYNIKKFIRCITLNNFNNCDNTKSRDKNKLCLSLITDKNNSNNCKSDKNNNISSRIINFKQNIIINYFNYSEDSDETFGNNNLSEITFRNTKIPKPSLISQRDSYYTNDYLKHSQIKENNLCIDLSNNENNINNKYGKKKSFKYYLLNSSGNVSPNRFKII